VICFYAMHRYDLVFYARLIEVLNFLDVKVDFQLFITDQVFHIPNTQDFIQREFPNYLIVPTKIKDESGIFEKIYTFFNLRGWVKSHIKQECVLVLTDKSSPLSRSFLKQSSNAVLIQQIEEIGSDYTFDLKATIIDSIICMVLGAYFARWYVSHSSGGLVRGLKPSPMHKNITKLYHLNEPIAPAQFSLPPLNCLSRENTIVVFGSRFLSWPYFKSGNFEHRLELLTQIYTFIGSNFPLHEVIYLPHPLEKGEEFEFINKIFHGRCELVNNYFSSEHFLFENRKIDFTFSIGSTSSFSAFNMGFSAKVFYKMLDFPATIESTYDLIFSGLPVNFFADQISDLNMPCMRELFDSNGLVPIINAIQNN
jgi:hypothetical protein